MLVVNEPRKADTVRAHACTASCQSPLADAVGAGGSFGPGAALGRECSGALEDRDYPVVSGINLFFATAVVLTNLLTDLLYTWLDPRVRHE